MTTDKSRADALTERERQAINLARRFMPNDTQARAEAHEALDALLAASPVEQHEAAPPDMEEALRWTAGTLQEIVSGRWKGANESDKVSIGSATKTVSQVLDMADAALGCASQPKPPVADERAAWRGACEHTTANTACRICRDAHGPDYDARASSPNAARAEGAKLAVWYGPMPESNGKSNFTAILHNGDIATGITLDRSEYPHRVRYEADRARWLIGELADEPFILDYDADKHSGYVAPAPAQAAEPVRYFVQDNECGYEEFDTDEGRDKAHRAAIEGYLDDGWSEEVTSVVSGIITHITVKTDDEHRPQPCATHPEHDDENCDDCYAYNEYPDHNFETCCRYEPEPIAAPQPGAPASAPVGLTGDVHKTIVDAIFSLSIRADEIKESNTSLDGTWCDEDEKIQYEAEVDLITRLRALLEGAKQ